MAWKSSTTATDSKPAVKKVAVESSPDLPNKDAADAQHIGDRKRLSTDTRSAPLTQDSRGGGQPVWVGHCGTRCQQCLQP